MTCVRRDVPMGRVLTHYLREWHKQTPDSSRPITLLERNGGDDGTRTRGLCRDSEIFTRN